MKKHATKSLDILTEFIFVKLARSFYNQGGCFVPIAVFIFYADQSAPWIVKGLFIAADPRFPRWGESPIQKVRTYYFDHFFRKLDRDPQTDTPQT